MARKILLADDSVTAQNMGRKILADAGYDVITVNNGSAALKRIAELRPDLIVLDVYMPGYSGLEVCQRLKESADTAHIPVLLTVGKLEPFKPDEARRVRADAHIVKPFEASELLTAISKLEDRMVPQASDSPRFSASTAGVERFSGEGSGKKSSAKVPETDTGWKNRIRFPSKKKKEEEPNAEDLAAAEMATLADSRKGKKAAGNGSFAKTPPAREATIVPDIPRDITPEELDALSALAEKLDTSAPPVNAAPVSEGKKFNRRSTDRPSAPVEATLPVVETPKEAVAAAEPATVEEQPVVTEFATLAEVQAPGSPTFEVQANASVETAEVVESAQPVEEQKAEQKLEAVEQAASEIELANAASTTAPTEAATSPIEALPDVAAGSQDIASAQAEAHDQVAVEMPTPAGSVPFQVVTPQASGQPENLTTNAPADEQPSASAAESFPATNGASQPTEGPVPSEAELAAALQLLTPANADSVPTNGNYAPDNSVSIDQSAVEGPRWVAEAVALSPEESAISLESEMFGVPAVLAKAAAATSTDAEQTTAVSTTGADRNFGFSGIAAAVETRLAEAGMGANVTTWSSERERSAENAAASAAAALEASAELLAAASAVNPLMDQIGANVEQKIAANSYAESSQSEMETTHEPSSRSWEESSATFADAMNSGGQNNNEIDANMGQNGENHEQVVSAVNTTTEENSHGTEVKGQDSMSQDAIVEGEAELAKLHAADDSLKAMAAAAASDGTNSSSDANTIASIVDSVMADLRPRILEEITRKLAKK